MITSEYAMHSYGIRLCVIEIKISSKCKLEQKKSSIALVFYFKYVIECVSTKYIVLNKQLQVKFSGWPVSQT